MVIIIVGMAIGDATITPPAAANPKPIFLNTLKNLGKFFLFVPVKGK
jgi:hypothetical protein